MKQKYLVLLVDDDREVLHINSEYLKEQGYQVNVAVSIADAEEKIRAAAPDCIVMDVMMPGTDGFTGFSKIRRLTDAPILFLTGRMEEEARIRGLMLGADDYIVKPCSLRELSLRIMLNIRRQQKVAHEAGILEYPPLRIDMIGHKVYYDGREVAMSNREFDLLLLLARNPGETITFQRIGEELYGAYLAADRKNIMVNASRLRKKLESCAGMEQAVETVWGEGYRWNGN